MNEAILAVNSLTKIYKNQRALDNFDLEVMRGEIIGIIGPNGAGKSTLLRSIVGLTPVPTGAVSLFGSVDQVGLETNRHFIGALIESPAFIENLSARQNLIHYTIQRNLNNNKRIDEVLDLVDLANTGKKPVKNFSLGMKQRLAIAIALLHRPEILILDEPINGLDPAGIIHVRELLLKLNRESNLTILISSHILSELEQLATRFIFVNKGQKVADYTANDLAKQAATYYVIKTQDNSAALTYLSSLYGEGKFELSDHDTLHGTDLSIPIYEIAAALVKQNFQLLQLTSHQNDLENVFLNITGGGTAHVPSI